ncbi:MAG: glycosyl transferase [Chthoniobacteraceae bacterium]|nr:glycosyl transferase [Chthoniobacteraceae bacterium]
MSNRKGHILILVENLPVPFDRRVWMESSTLTAAGYKVSVISPCPPEELEQPNRVIDGIHVYRYPMPAPTRGKLSFVREFLYCLYQTAKLTRRIWKEDCFDVIQSCNPPDTFWYIARQYKKHGVKFVFDHHDLCPELYESKYARQDFMWKALLWLEKKQFETADAVIATNESYKQIALTRGGKRDQEVAVVRSGPRLELFKAVSPDEKLRRGRRYMGVYLGVMGVQDGVDYALRAIRHALDAGLTDTCFTFIGKGDAFDGLLQLAEELRLLQDGTVLFTGRTPDDELRQYLSTADFGIAPDPKDPLNDKSTMNKIVEYMAMGLPIVSFDLEESRFSAGGAAVYVPENDTRKLGEAIVALIAEPARRAEMKEIGIRRVSECLSWEHSEKVLLAFYSRLLNKSAAEDPGAESAFSSAILPQSGMQI